MFNIYKWPLNLEVHVVLGSSTALPDNIFEAAILGSLVSRTMSGPRDIDTSRQSYDGRGHPIRKSSSHTPSSYPYGSFSSSGQSYGSSLYGSPTPGNQQHSYHAFDSQYYDDMPFSHRTNRSPCYRGDGKVRLQLRVVGRATVH